MIDEVDIAADDDDDGAGPAVGGDDGGSVILWEIPSLHKMSIMKSTCMPYECRSLYIYMVTAMNGDIDA